MYCDTNNNKRRTTSNSTERDDIQKKQKIDFTAEIILGKYVGKALATTFNQSKREQGNQPDLQLHEEGDKETNISDPHHKTNIEEVVPIVGTTFNFDIIQNSRQEDRSCNMDKFNNGEPVLMKDIKSSSCHGITDSDGTMLRLYSLSDESGCPRYFVDKFLGILRQEMKENDFNIMDPFLLKRKAFFGKMHRKFEVPKPEKIAVTLETGDIVELHRFNFKDQLQHHLKREDLYGDLNNLNVNKEVNGLWSYHTSNGYGINRNGKWYHQRFGNIPHHEGLENFVLFPIGVYIYMDRTSTTYNSRFGLEPVMMTTDLLTENKTTNPDSWFLLGYLPEELHFCYSKCKNATEKLQIYHDCLSVLLKPLKELQHDPPVMEVMIGKYVRRVKLKIYVSAVLGDGKSNDTLCTRIRAHNTLRLSRSCLIPTEEAVSGITAAPCWIRTDNLEHLIQSALGVQGTSKEQDWLSFLETLDSSTSKSLYNQYSKRRSRICKFIVEKVFRNHVVRNAFFGIDFLNSKYGIFGHTPTDVMHCLEEGIFKYVQQTILEPLPESVRKQLDTLVNTLFSKNRLHGLELFPRCNFSNGFSSLSYLSSDERVGVILVLIIVMSTKQGKEILSRRFHPSFDMLRKEIADKFKGSSKQKNVHESSSDDDILSSLDDSESTTGIGKKFENKDECWDFLKKQMITYGLQYIVIDVIPTIPDLHCWELIQVIWKETCTIKEREVQLPGEELDYPNFGNFESYTSDKDFDSFMENLRQRINDPFFKMNPLPNKKRRQGSIRV